MLKIYRSQDRIPVIEHSFAIIAINDFVSPAENKCVNAEAYVFALTDGRVSARKAFKRTYDWGLRGPSVEKGTEFVLSDLKELYERTVERWAIETLHKIGLSHLFLSIQHEVDPRAVFRIVMRRSVRDFFKEMADETQMEELKDHLSKWLTTGVISVRDSISSAIES